MSLLLDALRRLEVAPPAKTAPATAAKRPRAVRVEEPVLKGPSEAQPATASKAAVEPAVECAALQTALRQPSTVPSAPAQHDAVQRAATTSEAAWAGRSVNALPPKLPNEPAAISAAEPAAVSAQAPVEVDAPRWNARPAEAPATDAGPRVDIESSELRSSESTAIEPPRLPEISWRRSTIETTDLPEPARGVVELPIAPKLFDCRGLAAALRRMRPTGGSFVFVSVGGDAQADGPTDWSADLAAELSDIAAENVDRFASGGVDLESFESNRSLRGYRLYFVGSNFATSRGARLRRADGVLLVVHEATTSLRAAEVVRGAMAAQGVEFAGLVYVRR